MRVWELNSDPNNFVNLSFLTQDNDDKYQTKFMSYEFDGRSLLKEWVPLPVRLLIELKKSDTPSLSAGIPVFNRKSIETLSEFLDGNVELLPLISSLDEYYLVNVINVRNCIDYDRSEFKRYSSSGRIMRFMRYSFLEEEVKDQTIFKISDLPKSRVFVTDAFREKVLSSRLVGYEFVEVWDSESM